MGRLHELSNTEWRDLFMALSMEVHVGNHDDAPTWLDNHWWQNAGKPEVLITFGLPLHRAEDVGDIVLQRANPRQ